MAKFKGSQCLVDCGGHKEGYGYAKRGGSTQPHRNAKSFKKGMDIYEKEQLQKQNKKEKQKARKETLQALATGIAAGVTYTVAKDSDSLGDVDV